MSIFGKIKDAIFGKKAEPVTQTAAPADIPQIAIPIPSAPADLPPVDVDAVLTAMAANNSQTLNWRTSIVDLMKLLDLDSSLDNRKELATELGFTGDKNDSATMNIWLHKQVMRELAANGGVVPADLKD